MVTRSILTGCAALLILSCSKTAATPAQAPVAATPLPELVLSSPPSIAQQKSPERGVVVIAAEIRKACALSDKDAYFDFDSAKLDGADRSVLQRVVACFNSGPLAGRSMRLIGHADPRGDTEYNMVLGGSRADNVKQYLQHQGLSGDSRATTSRGELDATGTDEAAWARERRVDLTLGK
jgi:peptidoglycan-associated lipoprotein